MVLFSAPDQLKFLAKECCKKFLCRIALFLLAIPLSAGNVTIEHAKATEEKKPVGGCTGMTVSSFQTVMDYCTGQMCGLLTMTAFDMHGVENWHIDFGNGKMFDTTTNITVGVVTNATVTFRFCNIYTTPGTYTITASVTPAHSSCMSSQVVNFSLPTFNTTVNCFGGTSCITFTPQDPIHGPYTYQWTGPGGFTSTAQSPCGVAAGSYSVQVTGTGGCVYTQTVAVTQPASPITANIQTFNCASGTATVSGSGGTVLVNNPTPYNEPFSGGAPTYSLTTIQVSPEGRDSLMINKGQLHACDGIYDLTTTGCIDIANCSNTRVLFDASRWQDFFGGPVPVIQVYYRVDGGAETLLQTVNALNNTKTTFTSPALPAGRCVTLRFRINCGIGGLLDFTSVMLDNIRVTCSPITSEPYFYTWCNGQTTPNVTGLPPTGTCTVTVTDRNGCTATTSVNCGCVTPTVTVNSATICPGANATLTASGATTYSWSTGAIAPSITVNPLTTTSYTVIGFGATASCSSSVVATVTVNPQPVITINPVTICTGRSATLTANGASTYTWSTGTQGTSITVSPTITTTYTLTGTSAAGCTGTASVVVTVNPNPVITATNATICAGDNATLTAGGGVSYTWSTGAQTPSISAGPLVTTSYTVNGTDANGCTGSAVAVITINNNISVPVPPATICLGFSATLTAGGSGVIFTWSTGAQGPSITVTPIVTTTYTVSGTSAAGCTGTGSVVVTVNPLPVITTTPATVCIGNSATVSANGAATYTWSTGAQTQSITVNPTITSTYTVNATDANGCTGSATVVVTINPNPVITVNTVTICVGDNATLTAGGGSTYTWSTGVQTPSINVNPTITTSYTVTGTDANGCTGSAVGVVNVNNNITISVPNDTICQGGTATLVGNGPGGTVYSWSTGQTGGSISVTPVTTTPYSVLGTSPAGCTGSTTVTVVVTPLPVPNFTSTPVCQGLQTCFTDLSTIAAPGAIVSWTWNFGDGGGSNQQNPCHTYTTAGTFNVSLSITSNGGCSATFTATAVVNPLPVAGFTVTPVCLNQQSCFTDQSTTASGTITAWTWTFGDGSPPDNTQNPCHIYPNPGTYTVCLIVQNNFGCLDTICSTATVYPLPVANFNSINVCQGLVTTFTDLSTVNPSPPNTITQWLWNFGDNVTSTQQTPTHTYAEACTYVVTLTARTNNGCISNFQKSVEVYPNPVASFTATMVCQGSATQFTDMSTVVQAGPNCTTPPAASIIATWSWDFGDTGSGANNNSTLQNPSHTYSVAGTYVVTLTVTTNHGCSNTFTAQVTVHPPANPLFTANRVCLGTPTQFTDGSTVSGGGNIINWTWDFGDNTPMIAGVQNPSHTYLNPGTFTVTLIVSTSFGCLATTTLAVIVDPIPVADFMATEVCLGLPTVFTDGSTVPAPGGTITGWTWNFGEPSSGANNVSNVQHPSHTYSSAGLYTVSLIVRTSNGCMDTIQKPVNVWAIPVVIFGPPARGCKPVCVNFYDSSTVAPPSVINSWSWNFGDPQSGSANTSNLQAPSHCYTREGDYSVQLTVTSDKGCPATLRRDTIIHVYPFPNADFVASPAVTTIYNPTISFRDLSTGGPVRWYWTFEEAECQNDSLSDTVQNPIHIYCDTGRFTVCLVIWNQNGCPDTICKVVIIGPEWTFYIPNAFSPNGDGFNDFFIGKSWNVTEHQMWIFDRWGNMIYTTGQTKDPESAVPWDGRANGGAEPAQEDVYVWVVQLKDVFHKSHKYIGHVTLVK